MRRIQLFSVLRRQTYVAGVLFGLGLGLAGAIGLTKLMSSLLYGVSSTDITTFVAVPLLLAAMAVVAVLIPARRATKVDPIEVLRVG